MKSRNAQQPSFARKSPRKRRVRRPGLSEELRVLVGELQNTDVSYNAVLRRLSRGGHAFLLVLLSFTLCFPVGIPVVTTLLGLLCAMVGLFLFLGQPPWLPKKLRNRIISREKFTHQMDRLVKVITALERLLHPRLPWIAENRYFHRMHGLYVFMMGLIAAIPLPLPLGNFVAAFPILLMGLGIAERDGVFILVAYFAGIPCFLYYGALAVLGFEGVQRILHIM